jgi:hypothetical protein
VVGEDASEDVVVFEFDTDVFEFDADVFWLDVPVFAFDVAVPSPEVDPFAFEPDVFWFDVETGVGGVGQPVTTGPVVGVDEPDEDVVVFEFDTDVFVLDVPVVVFEFDADVFVLDVDPLPLEPEPLVLGVDPPFDVDVLPFPFTELVSTSTMTVVSVPGGRIRDMILTTSSTVSSQA